VPDVGPVINATDKPFEPGIYLTVVNIYNFNDFAVEFSVRAVVARSQHSAAGTISPETVVTLQPNEATGIDCVDVKNFLGGGFQAIGNGVLEIQARHDLKVTSAYTQCLLCPTT
jgi:hypothetical protein